MALSFGRFALDEQARSLHLDGQARPLQPLVFDLLAYLVRQRERVVPKEELLTHLWEGAIVTDSSLQRAVSLLRAVLREGDLEDAVQTFARRGYRFCASVAGEDDSSLPPSVAVNARRLADAGHWDRALIAFAAVADESTLSPDDWEAWGNAALCAGQPEQSVSPFERAVAAFESMQALESAARVSLVLANVKVEARELAVARGWHERARTFLRGLPEGKQHGFAEWLSSRMALFEGRLDESRERACAALAIAERIADPDLHCLGLIYQGHILIAQSDVRRGLSLHDEAGAAVLAGRVSPWVGGIVFCSVIWAYLHLGDHHRAGQWADQFTRWCERHSSYCYPALCRLHRGEVLALRGDLEGAEAEVRRAREQLAVAGPFVEGDACRVLGEIRLSRGDLAGAEASFREAHRLGWNPQPGLSLLLAERGDLDGALRQLEQALTQPTWTDGQRRGSLLAVLARIAATSGRLERAQIALTELANTPALCVSHATAAECARAQAEVAWANGNLIEAEQQLRRAVSLWLETSAPVHAANVRLRLCELLLDAGDRTGAELELGSAEVAYQQVRANPLLERCRRLREVAETTHQRA